jgi:hypothetical protein
MSLNLGIIASSRATAPSAALLLDTYPGAAAAYSLRKLRTAYTGAAIRVRRSSDNVQLDIKFTSLGDFDSVALSTFCGGNSGFVVTWYDQSGNSNNATQSNTSLQPLVYDTGVLVTFNSKPSIKVKNQGYLIASTATGAGNGIQYVSSYIAYNLTTLNLVNYLAYETGTDAGILAGGTFSTLTGFGIVISGVLLQNTIETTNNILKLGGTKSNTVPSIYFNGSLSATGTIGGTTSFMLLFGGSSNTSQQSNIGGSSEMIFYNTDQTSNNSGINSNINSYYSIY